MTAGPSDGTPPTPTSRTPCCHDQPRTDPVSHVHSTLWQKELVCSPLGVAGEDPSWSRGLPGSGAQAGRDHVGRVRVLHTETGHQARAVLTTKATLFHEPRVDFLTGTCVLHHEAFHFPAQGVSKPTAHTSPLTMRVPRQTSLINRCTPILEGYPVYVPYPYSLS